MSSIRRRERPGPQDGRPRSVDLAEREPERHPRALVRQIRGRYLVVFDAVAVAVAGYLALELRLDDLAAPFGLAGFALAIAILVPVQMVTNTRFGLYSRRWRFASAPDLLRIVTAVAVGSFVAAILFYAVALLGGGELAAGFPRSFWFIEFLVASALLGGIRFAIRVAWDQAPNGNGSSGGGANHRSTLLYGAGQVGVLMARSALRDPGSGVRPVGFLDDDPSLAGGIVAGLPVFGGIDALRDAVARTGAHVLLITMPSAPGATVRRVVEAALTLHLEVRTVPSINDLLDGTIDAYRIRRVRVEDLLRRPMVTEHAAGVEEIIRDRVIVVTGGAGSIGSELARQVLAIGPRRLVLVDRAESPLYLIERELEMRRERGRGSGEIQVHLANVASRPAMERLIAAEAPDVIFHAAAYKHVPLMEEHPSDAIHVNVNGTRVLLDAAEAAGVPRFVLVSTDKAVQPSSVMGASKRVAEMLVADAARRTHRPYVSVRFGNVLGSTGSVVPIFQQQLEDGEPLTITHPEMTRYFMTIPEAAWLILDAAALGTNGDLFVLDMGEPIRIMDLARDLIRLAGRDADSQPIHMVGLRPGEKLHERLFYEVEAVEPTVSAKVLRALAPPPPANVREAVKSLIALADGTAEAELRETLLAYVRGVDGRVVAAEGEAVAAEDEAAGPVARFPVTAAGRDASDRERGRAVGVAASR